MEGRDGNGEEELWQEGGRTKDLETWMEDVKKERFEGGGRSSRGEEGGVLEGRREEERGGEGGGGLVQGSDSFWSCPVSFLPPHLRNWTRSGAGP
eukprot:246155-Hanusia_phi.AAC.1